MLIPTLFGDNLMDDYFDDFVNFPGFEERKPAGKKLYAQNGEKLMTTDIKETDSSYILAIDLPGFKKEAIQASIKEGYLTVSAQRTAEKDDAKYLRKERFTGSVQRTFYVGKDVRQEDVKAQFKDGVLQLTVPKKTEKEIEQSRLISIEG